MNTPCIIAVGITGSLPKKQDNPAVPLTIDEQVESTQQAFEAGADGAAKSGHCWLTDSRMWRARASNGPLRRSTTSAGSASPVTLMFNTYTG